MITMIQYRKVPRDVTCNMCVRIPIISGATLAAGASIYIYIYIKSYIEIYSTYGNRFFPYLKYDGPPSRPLGNVLVAPLTRIGEEERLRLTFEEGRVVAEKQ